MTTPTKEQIEEAVELATRILNHNYGEESWAPTPEVMKVCSAFLFLHEQVKELQNRITMGIQTNHYVETKIMDRVRRADELEKEIKDAPWIYFSTPPNGSYPSMISKADRNTQAKLVRVEEIEK